jgi:hypothetical protein
VEETDGPRVEKLKITRRAAALDTQTFRK